MNLKYDENRKPILIMEENGVTMTISFSDNPRVSDLKKVIVDLLTSAYENRVTI